MSLTIDAFKVAAWMLLRDLVRNRGLSEQWLRDRLGDEHPSFDTWLLSPEAHRAGEYCELILEAEGMPPQPETEPFDAGYVGLFHAEEYRDGTQRPGVSVAEAGTTAGPTHPPLMLLDLAFRGVLEDVRAKRCSAEEARAAITRYLGMLAPHK